MEREQLLQHLQEIRGRLLHCVYAFAVVFISLFYFSRDLFHYLSSPLLKQLPQDASLIATTITSPLITPIIFTLAVAIFITVPYTFQQLYRFIVPGLYQSERKMMYLILLLSTVLFYLGVMFAYFIISPLLFKFVVYFLPENIAFLPDMSQYLYFCLRLFFVFGLIFEIPVLIFLLVRYTAVQVQDLIKYRPYVIVSAFILGMLLTPPDVLSQVLLAIPMWLLYEIGIVIARATHV